MKPKPSLARRLFALVLLFVLSVVLWELGLARPALPEAARASRDSVATVLPLAGPKTKQKPRATVRVERPAEPGAVEVYTTKMGSRYHRAGCAALARSSVSRDLAGLPAWYAACPTCSPPPRS